MKAQELRNKIEQVLGDNLRCLLPSYWWKNLFHSVADRIDDVEEKVDKKADGVTIVSSEDALYSLNLPKGSMASVTKEGGKISECYQVMEGDLDNIESLWDRFTRVRCIEKNDVEIEVSNEMGIMVAFTSLELLSGNGEKYSTGQIFVGSDGTSVNIQCFSYDGTNTHSGIGALNKLLGQNDLRLYNVICEGISEEEALVILDQLFTINGTSDVYAKGGSWERLAKEGDLEGSGDGVELRDLYIYQNYDGTFTQLTEEQKAWNLETLELVKQGKAIVRTTLNGMTFILELFNEDNEYQFGYTQFSISGGMAISVYVAEDGLSGIKIEHYRYDSELSTTSINAVQNKVVTAAINNKADKTYVDNAVANVTVDTSGLATKEELNNAIATSITNILNTEV